jgi:hypothetical protein
MVATVREMLRAMAFWLRWADIGLARRAVSNAAAGVADRQQGGLEDACTLRDLDRICLTMEIEPSLVEVPARECVGRLDEESTCRVGDCLVRGDIVSPSSTRNGCERDFRPWLYVSNGRSG